MQVLLIAKNVLISVLPVLYQIAIAHHAKDKIEYHLQLIIHAYAKMDISTVEFRIVQFVLINVLLVFTQQLDVLLAME